jgi:hypothetical protein
MQKVASQPFALGGKIMIELPEAEVLAQQISATLTGKHIQKATANQSPHKFAWYSGDPAEYDAPSPILCRSTSTRCAWC